MKIIKLISENVKKIKAVEIVPDGNVVKITGRNEQGKTSVLDSILYALAGQRGIPEKVLREGQETGRIEIDLGEYKIERTFSAKGSYLQVTTEAGALFPSPQALLDKMTESLAFDPLAFAGVSTKEQVEQVKKLTGLDFDELENRKQALFEERTDIGRTGKIYKGLVEGCNQKEKIEPIDVVALVEKINYLSAQDAEIIKLDLCLEKQLTTIVELGARLDKEKMELKRLTSEKAKTIKNCDPERLELLNGQFAQAEETNTKAAEYVKYLDSKRKLNEVVKEYKKCTEEIEKLDTKKTQLIASTKMPIEGLSIDAGKVMYKGFEFSELSSAEKLRVSMAMAMAMNPDLKVILAKDASLLDESNMKQIEEMAKEKDYQVWLEIVDSTGKIGFYIEEGEIQNV